MQLNVFGKLQLNNSSFSRPKPLLVLCYLSLEGPQARRKIADLFWSDDGSDSQKAVQKKLAKLSVVLSQFKKSDASEVFSYESGLDPLPSQASTDAELFIKAIKENNKEAALSLYQGPFLNELGQNLSKLDVHADIQEWILERREFYAAKAQQVLLELAEESFVAGDLVRAKELAERAYHLKEAPEPEPTTLNRLNKLLSQTGSDVEDDLEHDVSANLEELSEISQIVFLALALQDKPNLTIVKNAFSLTLSEIDEAREELILNGLLDANTQILAQHMARTWLEERPTERMPLLLKLARHTPSEQAYSLYKRIYDKTQGFGGMGDLSRARKAYCQEAQNHMKKLEYAKAAELLAELRKVEEVQDAEADEEARFIEAYALERLGQFKASLALVEGLVETNANIIALKSVLFWRTGKSEEAQKSAQEALKSGLDWLWAKATANNTLGYLAFSDDDFHAAASHFKKAASLFHASGEKMRWVGSLNNYATTLDQMAVLAAEEGQQTESLLQEVELAYENALSALEEAGGNEDLHGKILFNIGVFWADRNNWEKAKAYYLEAQPLIEQGEAQNWHTRLFSNLGNVYQNEGEKVKAKASYLKAIDYAVKAGEYLYQAIALANLAYLEGDIDSMEVALDLLEDCGNKTDYDYVTRDYEKMLVAKLESALLSNHLERSQQFFRKLGSLYEKQNYAARQAKIDEALDALSQLTDLKASKDLLMAFIVNEDHQEDYNSSKN